MPREVEGLLDVMDDAVLRCDEPLTHERLCARQGALFPDCKSGLRTIEVSAYQPRAGPMQIVSGPEHRPVVHYEAPPSSQVPVAMEMLIQWINGTIGKDPLVASALAHLRFESIHPFEDGNGRISRALIDLILAREMGVSSRLIRISERLLKVRSEYYEHLREPRTVDVTRWVEWFLAQVCACCEDASRHIDATIEKFGSWSTHREVDLSTRQRKVINLLLDAGPHGFEGGMSTRKYQSIAATSRPTASRELLDLAAAGLLRQVGAGRSTRYYVAIDGWGPAEDAPPGADADE